MFRVQALECINPKPSTLNPIRPGGGADLVGVVPFQKHALPDQLVQVRPGLKELKQP